MKKTRWLAAVLLAAALTVSCGGPAGSGTTVQPTDSSAPGTARTDEATEQTAPETPATVRAEDTEPAAPETEEETTEMENKELSLKIMTYNVKHCAEGIGGVVSVLKAADADIVGLQEIDCLTTRSGKTNQPVQLAKSAGYPYYRFTPAIDYQGGQYGTLILSKYPILSYETVKLDAGDKEGRAVGHAVLDAGGVRLDYFNTHLSFESKDLRRGQFAALAEMLSACDRFALTGDFNTQDFAEFSVLGAALTVNRADSRHVTFPGSTSAIDNIVLSAGFEEKAAGTVTESHSDHYAFWAELTLAR